MMTKLYWLRMGLRLGNKMLDKHQLVQLDHLKPGVIEKLKGSTIIEVGTLPLSHYPLLAEYATILIEEFDIETLADFYLIVKNDYNNKQMLSLLFEDETIFNDIVKQVECDIIPYVRDK